MKSFFQRYTPLQIAVHVYAWSALFLIALNFLTGSTSVNPIQELEQRTGRHAITLLVLSLACTPLNTLFRWPELIKRRRTLGLYAFLYATLHAMIFVNLDYGLAWSLIAQTVFEKPYILVGVISFLLLIPLAATSYRRLEDAPEEELEAPAHAGLFDRPAGCIALRLEQEGGFLCPAGRDHSPADLWCAECNHQRRMEER